MYFFEELGPRLYVTMAFVEGDDDGTGPSMADKLATDISFGTLCTWFCQVADGLEHAYSHCIRAHRDIKPGNILIGRDGAARVADFGLVATSEALFAVPASDGVVAGTPLYMAPEQFVNPLECDQRSDLYSIGVTLYQATSGGVLPFAPRFSPRTRQEINRYLSEVQSMHENAQPIPLASPLWPIIEKCLRKNPEDRFSEVGEFRFALDEVARRHNVPVPKRAQATEDFWAYRDQGNSLMRLGKYEESIAAFDAFLEIIRDDSALFNRAVCMENLGHYAEAFEAYERFAKSDNIGGLVNGSNCLRQLGRKAEAYAYAERAVALDAGDCSCWISLGNAAFALARWQDAMRAYSTARRLDSSSPTPAYNLALAAERAGVLETARQSYTAFLELSLPDDSRREYVEKALRRIHASLERPE
jgi:tetratricopeptide (TPR) repeat protein